MSYYTDKAKEFFDKLKPVLMNDVTGNPREKANPKAGAFTYATALFTGAGVGLLLGTMVGFSISPVVSGVIGTLTGLLAVLLGLSEKYMSTLKSVRIGAFGFFCVGGIFLGMYTRTNHGLLPSRQQMMLEYRMVGFTKQEALDFIAYREFGLVPTGWKVDKAKVTDTKTQVPAEKPPGAGKTPAEGTNPPVVQEQVAATTQRQFANESATGAELGNYLYSSDISTADCYKLNLATGNQPADEIKNVFEHAGGTWKQMARDLGTGLPEKIYIQALFAMRDCFCRPGQPANQKVRMTAAVKKINSGQSLEHITKTLSESGETWKLIMEKISAEIPEEYQKTVYINLIQIFKA